MQESSLRNTALVLEGGGFRGIFTAGVLDVFLKNKLIFSYALGVSAGATYGVSYVSQEEGRNLKVNDYISDKRYSSVRNFIRTGSLFSWDFIFDEIPHHKVALNYEAFKNSETQLWIGVTNCDSAQAEYMHLNPANNEEFKTILAATCSLPFIAPMVAYKNKLYMDGGLADAIPFEYALQQGHEKAVVILTRPRGYIKKAIKHPWFFKWYYRKHPNIAELLLTRARLYNQALQKLEALEQQGKVFVIRPEKAIEVSRLENNPQKTKKVFYQGVALAESQMAALKTWLELS